jgi:hypothetical protein
MLKILVAFIAGLVVLAGATAGRTDPHSKPFRPTARPTLTLPAPTATPLSPTDVAQPLGAQPALAQPSNTPDRSGWACQICIDVSGTPQWPSACTATQWWGGVCEGTHLPPATELPAAYP